MKAVNWERKPLGAVAYLCLGKMLDQNKNRGEPLPYLANVNVRWGEFELSDLRTMRFEPKEMDRYGLKFGDIVMCEGGEPGRCAIWKDQIPGMMIQKAIHRIRPKEFLDYRFLFYSFLHLGNSKVFDQYFTGATIKHLPGEKLAKVEVDIPPLPVQQRIAGILSAYDELIENSQRRIKILESMARALYREWFVRFRFPDHENHLRVTSPLGEIPQGWEVKRLDEVCRSIQDGDWIETKDQGGEDYRLLQISNVGVGEFIETGNFRYVTQETFARLRCNEIIPDDLLVARMPTPIGRGWLATKMSWRMITAVDVAIIRAEPTVLHPLFLVQAWNETSNLQRIAAQASGTTRLRITRRELAAMEFVIPPVAVQQKFAEIVQPQSAMIEALRQQIQNLRRTRDLLLPRLLSGQIDVSNLPEPVPA